MRDFRKLTVWQKAHETVLAIYHATRTFPTDERFGLTAQMRRAGVSIGSNIAEGAGRGSDQDFARFLHMAFGSASELEYQVLLSKDLGFIAENTTDQLLGNIQEVKRMLAALINRLTPPADR